jgi:SAM-dependent methyltransferase
MIALANIPPGGHILDLCCGIGRHSLEFARRGFKVTGVDRTSGYLNQAREQANKEGLNIEFVQEDMRGFVRADSFDTIINMFTSFGYFEDEGEDRRVIANIHRSLKDGGLVLMETMGKEILARVYREHDWQEVEPGVFRLEERRVDDDWSRMRGRWILFKDGRQYENTLTHRLYSAAELESLLREEGFGETKAYGGLDGIPYDHQARRLVIVGRKKNDGDFQI